jgi:hypothetical protein
MFPAASSKDANMPTSIKARAVEKMTIKVGVLMLMLV